MGKDDWKTFEKNDPNENQITILLIPNREGGRYFLVKKLPALLEEYLKNIMMILIV